MEFFKNVKDLNPYVRTILITAAFRIDDKLLQNYIKKKIINGFVQKLIDLHAFLKEVDTQLQSYEIQKKYPLEYTKHYKQSFFNYFLGSYFRLLYGFI